MFVSKTAKKKFEQDKELTEAELDQLAKQRFEGMKKFADLQAKYYDKFRKDLSARQVERVLHLNEPFDHKPCCGKQEGHYGGKHAKHGHKTAPEHFAE